MTAPERPNSGRIVDYVLGGTHHFPADVAAGNRMLALYSGYPQIFRDVRGFFGRVARHLYAQNIDRFLVFGAGIPTLGAIHETVPNAKVMYSDIDLLNVEIGNRVLANHSHCSYVYCDVTDLSTAMDDLDAFVRTGGSVGINIAGIACFLEDDVLAQTLQNLFDIAPPDSYLAIDFDSFAMPADTVKKRNYILRDPDTIRPLLGQWLPTPHDILPISLWHGDHFDVHNPGENVSHYGVLQRKY